jgi:uncharacterized protein (DUF1778 family)
MLNVRTTEKDYAAIRRLANFQGKSVSAFVMDAVLDKIEDWEDMQAVKAYERRKASGEVQYVAWEDVKKDLDA